MLKATLTVFVFFIGIAFISVGYVTVSKIWVCIDIGLGISCILGSSVFAWIRVMKRIRGQ
jgi:hypothetical protein